MQQTADQNEKLQAMQNAAVAFLLNDHMLRKQAALRQIGEAKKTTQLAAQHRK